MWRDRISTMWVAAAAALAACNMAEEPRMPPPPPGAERIADWGVFDQAGADALRRGLTELNRRWPTAETLETQLWQLPAGTDWPAVQAHYGQQAGWRADPTRRLGAGPLTPNAQGYAAESGQTMLSVAWFREPSVLVVQRARAAP